MTRTAITDAAIVTVDPADTVLDHGSIVFEDGIITDVLPAGAEISGSIDRTIDAGGGIVIPGLINAHTHLAMTSFRGFADDLDLQDFLGRLFPAETAIMPSNTRCSTLLVTSQARARFSSVK